jgi:hypothetical protein
MFTVPATEFSQKATAVQPQPKMTKEPRIGKENQPRIGKEKSSANGKGEINREWTRMKENKRESTANGRE